MVIVFFQNPAAFAIWLFIALLLATDMALQANEDDAIAQKDKRRKESLIGDKEAWKHLYDKWKCKKKVYTVDDTEQQTHQALEASRQAIKDFEYIQKR